MNSTITKINDNTMDMNVREFTKTIIANVGKKFKATFMKKDGCVRTMIFTPSVGWNRINGKGLTSVGWKIVNTKCKNNIATVIEYLDDGVFQPRSINFSTMKTLEVI